MDLAQILEGRQLNTLEGRHFCALGQILEGRQSCAQLLRAGSSVHLAQILKGCQPSLHYFHAYILGLYNLPP